VQDPAPYRALVTGIEALARVQREVGTLLARELDTPRASLTVVRSLAREGEMTVGDLSTHQRVDLSVASRQISAAAEAGLVARTASDDPRPASSWPDRHTRRTISARRRSRARPSR